MMDELETIHGHKEPGFITGKPVGMGGSLGTVGSTFAGVSVAAGGTDLGEMTLPPALFQK